MADEEDSGEATRGNLGSESSFIESSLPNEDPLNQPSGSNSPDKCNTPTTSVASQLSEPHTSVHHTNSSSQVDTVARPTPPSEPVGQPLSFRVPSLTGESVGENTSDADVASTTQEQLSCGHSLCDGEKVETRDVVDSTGGVSIDNYGVSDRGNVVSDQVVSSEREEVGLDRENTGNRPLSVSESRHNQTSSQTVANTRSELVQDTSFEAASNTRSGFVHDSTLTPTLVDGSTLPETSGESMHHQTSTQQQQPSSSATLNQQRSIVPTQSLTQTSNTQHTTNCSAAISSPMATPTATPTGGRPHGLSAGLSVSPYVVVRGEGVSSGMVEASHFESPGLLYAKSTKERHNLDMLKPPDEVAEDVLEMLEEDPTNQLDLGEDDEEEREEGRGEEGVDGDWVGQRDDGGVTQGRRPSRQTKKALPLHLGTDSPASSSDSPGDARVPLPPLDPRVLRDLERDAKKVAGSLNYIMDNLHNSLHAMTVCAKQSVMLHREAVDNLHSVVDTNVKATYGFLAKFEELKRQTPPLDTLSQQIKDINKILKVLERS